jgi:hypothetical protein
MNRDRRFTDGYRWPLALDRDPGDSRECPPSPRGLSRIYPESVGQQLAESFALLCRFLPGAECGGQPSVRSLSFTAPSCSLSSGTIVPLDRVTVRADTPSSPWVSQSSSASLTL